MFVFRFNVLVNNFPVMSGQSQRFLAFNQYSGELMCLTQGHKMVAPVGWNLGPLDLESDALPLRHHAPYDLAVSLPHCII